MRDKIIRFMSRMKLLAWAASAAVCSIGSAEDWPEWRGAGRLGVWNDTGIIDQFPEDGLDFRWRAPIGPGYGGPAVAEGRVFATDYERGSRGTEGVERLLCLSEETGEILWTCAWEMDARGLMMTYANGPRATPTVDEDRVYVLGSTGRLSCLSVADGSIVWRRDYKSDYGTELPPWGMVGAPLVDGPRLICLVGGKAGALVVAFDKLTGEELWRAIDIEGEPGYAPPVIVEAGGARQLIMWHPTAIHSLDPVTGAIYWQEPYEVSMSQTIATPLLVAGGLLVSSSSHGSTMLNLDPAKPAASLRWKGGSDVKAKPDGLHAFNSSPFFDDGYIYGIGGMGYLRCIEAESGRQMWATTEPNDDARIATAFLVKNGDRYFINNDQGDLIIARLTPEGYEEISRAKLIEPTNPNAGVRRESGVVNWTHPAYANGHIITRNDNEIISVSLKKPQPRG